jgi:hypothetical protein
MRRYDYLWACALNENQPQWRTGCALVYKDDRALIQGDIADRKVTIAVVGEQTGRREMLGIVRSYLEAIHRSIPHLSVVEQIPVLGHLVLKQEGVAEHFVVKGRELLKIRVAELLNGIEDIQQQPPFERREEPAGPRRCCY